MKLPVSLKLIDFVEKDEEYTEKQDGTLEVKFRVPSMALQDEMMSVREKHLGDLEKLDTEYSELKKFISPDGTLKIGAMTSTDQTRANEKLKKVTHEEFHYRIEYFKLIVNKKLLPTKQQELINQEYNHIFWNSQNIDEIGEIVQSFREVLQV